VNTCCECGAPIELGNVCSGCMLDPNGPRTLVAPQPSLLRPAVVIAPPSEPVRMTPELRRTLDFLKEPPTRGRK
jgi:hypothetical protein